MLMTHSFTSSRDIPGDEEFSARDKEGNVTKFRQRRGVRAVHGRHVISSGTAVATFVAAVVLVAGGVAGSATPRVSTRAAAPKLVQQTLLTSGVSSNEPISYSGKGFHPRTTLYVTACNSSVGKLKLGSKKDFASLCDAKSAVTVKSASTGALLPFAYTWPAVINGSPCPTFFPCCPSGPFFPCHVVLAAFTGASSTAQVLAAVLPVTYIAMGNATGGVTCGTVKGAMTFTPAVTSLTKGAYVQGLSLDASGCSAASSSGASVGRHSVEPHFPWKKFWIALGEAVATVGGSLAGGLGGAIVGGIVTFASGMAGTCVVPGGPTTGNSGVNFTNYQESFTSHGDMVFTFPWTGGKASVQGAFTDGDAGAASTLTLVTSMTYAQAVKAVKAKGGLKSIPIVSGHVTLQ